MPNTWINITGPWKFLPNRWANYTINYGNSGNIDAFFVPVVIAITDNGSIEIEQIDFIVGNSNLNVSLIGKDGTLAGTEVFNGKKYNTKSISFIIPVIQANSSNSLHLRIKANETFFVRTWDLQPLIENNKAFSSILKSAQAWPTLKEYAWCLGEAAVDEAQQYVIAKVLGMYEPLKEFADCIAAGGKELISLKYGERKTLGKFFFNLLGVQLIV
jgi:hypothetical protein